MTINIIHADSLEAMRAMPDKAYELAIVDPPYGIGIADNPFRQAHCKKPWDSKIPGVEYFCELRRVSVNQIVWGGNYFPLPPSQGFIVWDKIQPEDFSSSMCEFAWMSIQSPAKIFKLHVVTAEKHKIHPTQKPVRLYEWLLTHYAKPGDKILDTHGGSCSIAIACYDLGFDADIYEIDADYFRAATERFIRHQRQEVIPLEAVTRPETETLFQEAQ